MQLGRLLRRIIKKQFQDETFLDRLLEVSSLGAPSSQDLQHLIQSLPAFLKGVDKAIGDLEVQADMLFHNMNKSSDEQNAITKELRTVNALVKQIMNSLDEGYLSVDLEGRILPVYSERAVDFFGSELSGALWWEKLGFDQEKLNEAREWFAIARTERLPFDDLSSLAPPKVISKGRTLALSYKALRNSAQTITGLVIIAADVSLQLKAQREAKVQKEKADFLARVLVDPRPFQSFVNYFTTNMSRWNALETPTDADLSAYRGFLHNIKGSCGLFGLEDLVPKIHELEDQVACATLKSGAQQLRRQFDAFIDRHRDVLPSDLMGQERSVRVPLSRLVAWGREMFEQGQEREALDILNQYVLVPIESYFRNCSQTLTERALRQEKKIDLVMNFSNVKLPPSPPYENLMTSVQNILNNMVDHGVEPQQVRLLNNKSEVATITVEARASREGQELQILFRDDGQGLNLERIRKKAEQMGLTFTNEEDLKTMIFRRGFSTAETLSQTSGRGEGMAAVAEAVEQLGGRIGVHTTAGQGTEFVLTLPFCQASTLDVLRRLGPTQAA